FWRTKEKAEVDFIINFNLQLIPVEVKYKNFKQPAIERSLKSFIDKYQPARALVVTKDFHGKKKFGQTEVRFLPFWELISFKF
ncbi:DUF4143 domain-containing protein, partial [Patescibacteria group bacterium]|nr:DUF4143 domain-containing protein [Patescibacteria group bacterium]